ncbi:MAG: helix-turn-helix transcriptional regulator [Deltaproteobacteria bacterium]
MIDRVVKSKLALRGMTIKDLAEAIDEHYNSVYDVMHGKWGNERGIVATRILKKISRFLDIPELTKEQNRENI